MIYEAWRITYQSSEAAARAAYNTVEKLHEENQALRKYVDGLRAALGAQVRFSVEEFEKQGMRVVNAGAFQMVVNALRRDAEEGNPVRGAMADELLTAIATLVQQATTATDAGNPASGSPDTHIVDFLAKNYIGVDFKWGEPTTEVIIIEMPRGCSYSGDFRKDVATAMAAQEKQGGAV